MNKTTIKSRIFLVGCPRSGTTLLQTLLASHPEIISFPESHFFNNLLPENEPKRRLLGIASNRTKPRLAKFLRDSGVENSKRFLPKMLLFVGQYIGHFVSVLDSLTLELNKTVWVEKTPLHLHYLDLIEKSIPGVKFIHLVRNGADVVASLYDVSRKNPKVWGGARELEDCVNRWVGDVEITKRHLHKSNHILVKYGDLVRDSPVELKKLCDFIGVDFDESILENYGQFAEKFLAQYQNYQWKLVGNTIANSNSKKFEKVFDEDQKAYVLERLSGMSEVLAALG